MQLTVGFEPADMRIEVFDCLLSIDSFVFAHANLEQCTVTLLNAYSFLLACMLLKGARQGRI